MQLQYATRTLTKRHPLTISRGTSTETLNLFVRVEHDGIVGIGEMSPVNIGDGPEDSDSGSADVERWIPALEPLAPWEMQRIESTMDALGGGRAVRAAVD